jgi:Zn-dependent peptidase ImmA (M78 family)
MTLRVPFISEADIERDAQTLLAEYASSRDITLMPPIPIEDIIEKHLKLRVDFDDLHKVLDVPREGVEPDIFGAIWLARGEIFIDESLDPDEHPSIEGRYRFTLAHEGGGHWRLHRRYLAQDQEQTSLFGEVGKPTFVCRSSQAKERVEWQADFYASCMLMPKSFVTAAWCKRFGNDNPQLIRRGNWAAFFNDPSAEFKSMLNSGGQALDDQLLEHFARPFAQEFKVSPVAMRIRLERLGLLYREVPRQRSLLVRS